MKALVTAILLVSLTVTGCKTMAVDPIGIPAAKAGDYTLFQAAPDAQWNQGGAVYRFINGSTTDSEWELITPAGKRIKGGEIRIRYNGTVTTVAIDPSNPVQKINWKDIVNVANWATEYSGLVQATASIKYQGPDTEEFVDYLGIAYIIVLPEGYTPLPFGSNNAAFSGTCVFEMSTAGRTAGSCK